jgi:FMN phosphatase YigB (HAD superfamily)
VATIHAYLPGLRLDDADRAFTAGMRYLNERHRQSLRTVAEERERFGVFYGIVLETLGVQDPPPALLQALVEGEDDEVAMEPFPEVAGVLGRLCDRGLRLGILTENWPSVETAYQRLGLRSLFAAFVISAQEARLKDDPELFAIAAARMDLPQGRCCSSMTGPPMSRPPLRSASTVPSLIATLRRPPFPGSPT